MRPDDDDPYGEDLYATDNNNWGQLGIYKGYDYQIGLESGNQTEFRGVIWGNCKNYHPNPNLLLFDNYVKRDVNNSRVGFDAWDCGPGLTCGGDPKYNTLWQNGPIWDGYCEPEPDAGIFKHFGNCNRSDIMYTFAENSCLDPTEPCDTHASVGYVGEQDVMCKSGEQITGTTAHGYAFMQLHCGVLQPGVPHHL